MGARALEERAAARLQALEALQRTSAGEDDLTPREVEVLRLIAIGRTNADIATALAISLNTVATHVRSILAKTGSSNRTEAAALAMRRGLAPQRGITEHRAWALPTRRGRVSSFMMTSPNRSHALHEFSLNSTIYGPRPFPQSFRRRQPARSAGGA